jgi:glycosyltransferase involved in cell wall biosynthesis
MPFSSNCGKGHIKRIVNRIKPKTALDIGCGVGTYAKLFPHLEWTGVEIWEPYIEKYDLKSLYPTLHSVDAREWIPTQKYDVAFLGDVLEHMTVTDARYVLERLRECSETVIVSIPMGYYPQDAYEGNPHEEHITHNWNPRLFHSVFGVSDWHVVDGDIGVFVYTPHSVALKIAVYAISKNEAHFIPRFCESAKEADLILIADTGSDDGLPDVAREHGAVVHDICITPWRFDLARNAALALIPRDVDVCISLDIDEVLQPGWRQEIERVWTGDTTRLRYMFDWGAGIAFYYEKIHARHGYMWHHPCHEYPIHDGRITEVWAQTDMLLAVHMPDPTKSRGQYMDLLELSVKEDPYCPRNAFYYARELSFHYRWHDSIAAIDKYLKMPEATWPNERCYAYRTAARCWSELGNFAEAERNYHLACAEAPNTREPWCELAKLMYMQHRWAECFAYSMRALQIVNREQVYTCDPEVWGHWPHDLAAISAYWLGMKNVALEQGRLAVEKSPDDLRLQDNVRYYQTGDNDNSEAA